VIFYHPQSVFVFLHLNNSLGNKWFNFKVPFRSICTIIPFLTCFLTRHPRPIMPKFYHVLAQGQAPSLQLNHFSQPFNYLPQFFAQHFVRVLDYPILQLQTSLDMCAHIPSTLWVSTFMLYSWQWTHWNPWCNSWCLCQHCTRCWFPHGMKIITCTSFNHIQLLSLTGWPCVYQK
jgi:hypothetical protein